MVLKYFSPLVLCTSFLCEPLVSQAMGCLFNIDKIPGVLTFIGGMVALVGIFLVGIGPSLK
jgi:hypothetical protein